MGKCLLLFAFGLVYAPCAILLHESGHFLTAKCLGLTASFHAAEITLPPQPDRTIGAVSLVGAGGPLVDAISTLIGFFWLRCLRRDCLQKPVTGIQWLATFMALTAARWLRCFSGTPANPQPGDEARLSHALGMPDWLLPYLLLPGAVVLLALTIRLHPRGARLYPFGCAIFGLFLGAFLWVKVIGPRIME